MKSAGLVSVMSLLVLGRGQPTFSVGCVEAMVLDVVVDGDLSMF